MSSSVSSLPCTLLIGSEPLLAAWNARAKSISSVTAILHTDLSQALEMIGTRQPQVVVIEQAVAASGSGSALMARLHIERFTRGIEVRLLPPERAADLMSSEPGDVHPQVWLSVLAEPLPARPQRRARRIRVRDDEQAFIDGTPVVLLDLSAVGAQVCSPTVLRPQQRVRVVLSPERGSVKTAAVVAWSTFEAGPTPRYRAGIAFTNSIPNLIDDGAPAA
ncbi:MAG TPA: PilZ domain-containing protein [Vicinamibacterales bacterium]|nr:PilZ domain-containing protein [Vicinamibacterales bacterium]